MNIDDFKTIFGGHIRTLLDLESVEDCTIYTKTVTKKELGDSFLPWYQDNQNITIEWLSQNLTFCKNRRSEKILNMAQQFLENQAPVVIPCLELTKDKEVKRVIVDGCHRSCAAYIANKPESLLLCSVSVDSELWSGSWDFSRMISQSSNPNRVPDTKPEPTNPYKKLLLDLIHDLTECYEPEDTANIINSILERIDDSELGIKNLKVHRWGGEEISNFRNEINNIRNQQL